MYKFEESFYNEFKSAADHGMASGLGGNGVMKDVPNRRSSFLKWIELYKNYTKINKVKFADIPQQRNEIYSELMTQLQSTTLVTSGEHEDLFQYMADMSLALIYAAEAYHTRGAIRHAVGVLQMKKSIIANSITVMDYWVSMIENWAYVNKVYNHCHLTVGECFIKMSKYLFRTFNAMKNLHRLLSETVKVKNVLAAALPGETPEYLHKGNPRKDPELMTRKWVEDYKGKRNKVPYHSAKDFLDYIGCQYQNYGAILVKKCMKNIQNMVQKYNRLLVNVTRRRTTEFVLMVTRNKQEKKPSFPLTSNQV